MNRQQASEITAQLVTQHTRLRQRLGEVESFGVQTQAGAACLASLCRELLQHLEEEDRVLYEPLFRAAGIPSDVSATYESFFADLLELKAQVLALHDAVTCGTEVRALLGGVSTMLDARLTAEETVLFPLLGRLSQT